MTNDEKINQPTVISLLISGGWVSLFGLSVICHPSVNQTQFEKSFFLNYIYNLFLYFCRLWKRRLSGY